MVEEEKKKKEKKKPQPLPQVNGMFDFTSLTKTLNKGLSNQILHAKDTIPGKAIGRHTGVPTIDYRINGALPGGKCHYFFGPQQAGKTTMMLHLIKEAQADNCPIVYIDAEHAADITYMMNVGIDPHRPDFTCYQPYIGEDAFRLCIALMQNIRDSLTDFTEANGPLVLIDTLKALVPEMNLEDKNPTALLARLLSNYLNHVKALANLINSTLVLVNQVRTNPFQMFGNPETEPGGMAVQHIPDTKYRFGRVGKNVHYKDGSTGHATRTNLVKAKHCSPFKKDDIWIKLGHGFNLKYDMVNFMAISGFTKKLNTQSWAFNEEMFARWMPSYTIPGKNKFKRADLEQIIQYDPFDFYTNFMAMMKQGDFFGECSPEAIKFKAEQDVRDREEAERNLSPAVKDLPTLQEAANLMHEDGGVGKMQEVLKDAGVNANGQFDPSMRTQQTVVTETVQPAMPDQTAIAMFNGGGTPVEADEEDIPLPPDATAIPKATAAIAATMLSKGVEAAVEKALELGVDIDTDPANNIILMDGTVINTAGMIVDGNGEVLN